MEKQGNCTCVQVSKRKHVGLEPKVREVIGWERQMAPSTSTVWGSMGAVFKSRASGKSTFALPSFGWLVAACAQAPERKGLDGKQSPSCCQRGKARERVRKRGRGREGERELLRDEGYWEDPQMQTPERMETCLQGPLKLQMDKEATMGTFWLWFWCVIFLEAREVLCMV